MKICPYISFNGKCEEAATFYAKVFNVEAHIIRYKDAPKENGYEVKKETENLVMHAQLDLGSAVIMLCDTPPEYPVNDGSSIAMMAEFDDADGAKKVFDALKEGGEIHMELQETFWSKCFGSVTDKFGIDWNITIKQ